VTLPKEVRRRLGVGAGGPLAFELLPDGRIVVGAATREGQIEDSDGGPAARGAARGQAVTKSISSSTLASRAGSKSR
jgi:bifunctional DNA-binding transcriptional regulator/antitoxin component of YhaV-PrlF toxin-antitoxin module